MGEIGLRQKVRKRVTLGVSDSLSLRTRLAQVDLDNLVVDDLSQMDGCGFIAMTTFQIFRHNLTMALPFKIAKQKHTLSLGSLIIL